jgi:hypothetical protein
VFGSFYGLAIKTFCLLDRGCVLAAVQKGNIVENKLRVWWVPQVPRHAFHYPVANIEAAMLLLDALAKYDLFQLENNIQPDFCNAGGLEEYEGGEWTEWYENKTGETIDEIIPRFF